MQNTKLATLKKQQTLLFFITSITTLMALMKYFNVFSTGLFPFYVEAGIAIICLFHLVTTSIKIKKIETDDQL